MPRIIPVIDVMHGRVVRASGGERWTYRPIASPLVNSDYPLEVARALIEVTDAEELYVADLDAIMGLGVSEAVLTPLRDELRVPLLADLGLGTWRDFHPLLDPPTVAVVGLETLESPGEFVAIADFCAPRLALSIDLWNGALADNWQSWQGEGVTGPNDIVELAEAAVRLGGLSTRLIVLDLANVGGRQGPTTLSWCRRIKDALPEVDLVTGGGTRNWDDVRRLADAGADGVLVASALHDGTLTFPRPIS
jgi:phosphoribosylformimino-5-aminoimidazole carboxamide ribotide isomerase